MTGDKFDNINIGDEAEIVHTIIEKDVDQFADLTGDTNPLHINDKFASTTHFKKRVVHGMLTASFISTIIGTKLPGEGALWYELNIRFLSPVRMGETIKVTAKVTHKSISLRVVSLDILILGDDQREVIQGEAKVKVLEQKKKIKTMEKTKGAVIVTGGSRGIGEAIARELANDGYKVVVNFLKNEKDAEKVVQEIISNGGKALMCQADIRSIDAVKDLLNKTIDKFGTLSGLVNNASPPLKNCDFLELSWEDIQFQIDVQLKGSFLLSKSVMPYFLDQGYGNIVNIGSIYTDNVPPINLFPYVLAKSGLTAFSKSLAVQYGPKNIRVNCVAPGMTDTDLIADVPEKVKMVTKMQTPLRSLAETRDIGEMVSFLFSEKAKHITGETIRVCGGQVMI